MFPQMAGGSSTVPGINSDPQFRKSFCEMCIAAGVDPLSSSHSGCERLDMDGINGT